MEVKIYFMSGSDRESNCESAYSTSANCAGVIRDLLRAISDSIDLSVPALDHWLDGEVKCRITRIQTRRIRHEIDDFTLEVEGPRRELAIWHKFVSHLQHADYVLVR